MDKVPIYMSLTNIEPEHLGTLFSMTKLFDEHGSIYVAPKVLTSLISRSHTMTCNLNLGKFPMPIREVLHTC